MAILAKTERSFLLLLLLLCALILVSPGAHAQSPPKFQPPRPPSDADFDDPTEDELELGDQPGRMPPPGQQPPPPMPGAAPAMPANDFRPTQAPPGKIDPSKVHFQLVEGAFFEKGKKRGRAPLNKRQ